MIQRSSSWLVVGSQKAQTALVGVVVLRYRGVDNEVPQLHATLSEPLDKVVGCHFESKTTISRVI